MEQQNPLIVLQDISKVYPAGKNRSVVAVKEINLRVDAGEFVVITGRSGCGKTTLLNLISGLTRPTSGKVLFEQIEVWKLPDARQAALRNQKIGFVFQFPSLMPALNAMENVILPTIVDHRNHRAPARERALKLLEEVGLADKLDAYPRQLSAGQQQRVVIARALINQPELLLADEPTSNLDEKTEREILALLRDVQQQHQITVMLVTHAIELVSYGTRSVRMAAGKIVA
jgi:ABC-type lipoprotein export system ATPase subunit